MLRRVLEEVLQARPRVVGERVDAADLLLDASADSMARTIDSRTSNQEGTQE